MSSVLVTPWRSPESRAFRALAATSGKDMLRNPLSGFAMLFLAGIGIVIYLGIWFAFCVLDAPCTVDPLRANLGVAAMNGIASLAFVGTTVPLVAMRERGILRLFGTTPLRRSVFLLAQLPTRLAVALVVVSAALGIALWRGYFDAAGLAGPGLTFALGTAMLLALSLLLAARARNAESAQQTGVMLTIVLMWASGGLLPPEMVPGAVQFVLNCLPTTWFAAAAGAGLTGATPFLPVPALWLLMLAATGLAAWVAARSFVWDQAEPSAPARIRDPRPDRTHPERKAPA